MVQLIMQLLNVVVQAPLIDQFKYVFDNFCHSTPLLLGFMASLLSLHYVTALDYIILF